MRTETPANRARQLQGLAAHYCIPSIPRGDNHPGDAHSQLSNYLRTSTVARHAYLLGYHIGWLHRQCRLCQVAAEVGRLLVCFTLSTTVSCMQLLT